MQAQKQQHVEILQKTKVITPVANAEIGSSNGKIKKLEDKDGDEDKGEDEEHYNNDDDDNDDDNAKYGDTLKLGTFMEFIKLPVVFYKTIGEDIFDYRSLNVWLRRVFKSLLFAGFLNFNLLVLGGIIFFVKALGTMDTIVNAIAVAPCIGFSFVADFKHIALLGNKKLLQHHFDEMEQIFPKTNAIQKAYRLKYHVRQMRSVMMIFSVICLAYTSTFSLYPACKSFVQYYLMDGERFERYFGFLIWYPYNATRNNWIYWMTYMGQVHAAYFAGVAFLSADLLLVTSITQLRMHFDYVSERLSFYQPDVKNEKEDIKFLAEIIRQHIKCLELSEHVNTIFSFSLLLNFLTASLTICFIGFQVTTSTLEVIVMYCIFLLASMLQVFIVCYYGEQLMAAVISMSYRFFALLRTTYYGD